MIYLVDRDKLLKDIMDDGGLQYPRWWYVDKVKNAKVLMEIEEDNSEYPEDDE